MTECLARNGDGSTVRNATLQQGLLEWTYKWTVSVELPLPINRSECLCDDANILLCCWMPDYSKEGRFAVLGKFPTMGDSSWHALP